MNKTSFFNRENPWEKIFSKHVPNDLLLPYKEFSSICEYMSLNGVKTVLDVAMGHGRHTMELLSRNFNVYGFDLSESALSLAKEMVSKKFPDYDLSKISYGNMFKYFSYKDKQFDCVVAIQAIYHGFKEDMQESIFQISRVLKKDGIFIFTVSRDVGRSTTSLKFLDKREMLLFKIDDMTYLPLSGRERGLVHFYPSESVIRKMLKSNFSHVIIREDLDSHYYIVRCIKK